MLPCALFGTFAFLAVQKVAIDHGFVTIHCQHFFENLWHPKNIEPKKFSSSWNVFPRKGRLLQTKTMVSVVLVNCIFCAVFSVVSWIFLLIFVVNLHVGKKIVFGEPEEVCCFKCRENSMHQKRRRKNNFGVWFWQFHQYVTKSVKVRGSGEHCKTYGTPLKCSFGKESRFCCSCARKREGASGWPMLCQIWTVFQP